MTLRLVIAHSLAALAVCAAGLLALSPAAAQPPRTVDFTYTSAIPHEPGVARRDPSDVILVDGTYYLWYSKITKADRPWRYPSGYSADVYYATSADGRQWEEQGRAVGKGGPGDWDEHGVFTPNILAHAGKYYLYYTGVAAGHGDLTPTNIGVAVSDSPDGPWAKHDANPVLSPSDDPAKFDSMRVDDASLVVRDDKVWFYYKGREQGGTPAQTDMGVALSDSPLGPFTKHAGAKPLHPGHEVLVWPQDDGVASLATSAGPKRFYFAADGLDFQPGLPTKNAPAAPGCYRADSFAPDATGEPLRWGISHASRDGDLYLVRFDVHDPVQMLRDKGFDDAWIDSLTNRWEPRTYAGDELQYIGQPVGGLFAGQVYLGGDGRLWYWDIFNKRVINPGGGGDKFYNNPMQPDDYRNVGSGFVIEWNDRVIPLDARGFAEAQFLGEYPIAQVDLRDDGCPIDVRLQAFSPFLPTNAQSSSLPATILCYTLTNTSNDEATLRIGGWLENAGNRQAVDDGDLVPTRIGIQGASGVELGAEPRSDEFAKKQHADSGTMAIALLDPAGESLPSHAPPESWRAAETAAGGEVPENSAAVRSREVKLAPGESREVRFAVAWHFPNGHLGSIFPGEITRRDAQRHHYAKHYTNAGDVIATLVERHDDLTNATRLWRDTWYDSTLPRWFLDRTFANASTLATTAAFRLHDADRNDLDGRVYFWEGVYLGPGTCTHVTHYEQTFGRLFPNAARAQRQVTDFNASWDDNLGYVRYRAEWGIGQHFGIPHAIDGHCGVILRTYREHTTNIGDAFLKSVWPRVKRATQFMIDQDAGRGFFADKVPATARETEPDGVLEGPQYHTLDKYWNGVIPWTSGMYLAALRASEAMAREVGDDEFAAECRQIADAGGGKLTQLAFDERLGYYAHLPDRSEPLVNTNIGCHIDQLLGDYWTHQTGLQQVFPRRRASSALQSIFRHNLYRRASEYRDQADIKVHRFYADDDEPGTFICTFPHGGARDAVPTKGSDWDGLVAGYFSECMTGFTYQSAAHMISRGMVTEGLALCRAIHDRYAEAPLRRNPFNEVEYGNHYTRAMSSYAAFIAMTGFEYHGPRGSIGFAPQLTPHDFRAAFTAAAGWGTYAQQINGGQFDCQIIVRYGDLSLSQVTVEPGPKVTSDGVTKVLVDGKEVTEFKHETGRTTVVLPERLKLSAGEQLEITIR